MKDKKNFVLRINPDVFRAIEKWAADEFRSVNGQIEYLLHDALTKANRNKSLRPTEEEKRKDKD